MSHQRTFAIIKPDAVRMDATVPILAMATEAGLRALDIHTVLPPRSWWEEFYSEHKDRDFFKELIDHMVSWPSVFVIFEGENAIERWRALLGPTDPTKAPPTTIRGRFGTKGPANAVHGSDSPESASREIGLYARLSMTWTAR